jgi:DNA repair exonuclease SbcCD nuclease subunit
MSKPIAVLISDVHYSLPTLALADAAMRQAIDKANDLNVPLIVAGDLHDTKANLRGECVNAMLKTFEQCRTACYILRGNHDAINEKSKEHSLNFLNDYFIIDEPEYADELGMYLIPYEYNPDELRKYLKKCKKGSTLIMHQGLQSSNSGDYVHDRSAINKDDVSSFSIISGHYHTRQTIDLPNNGHWDYIGNPYSLTFGEAKDPEKGFQVLMEDGSLEFIPTNLRKHIVLDVMVGDLDYDKTPHWQYGYKPGDLLWVKVSGHKEWLQGVNKAYVAKSLELTGDFRLDLVPTDTQTTIPVKPKNNADLMDSLIDSMTNTSDDRKTRLKELWRRMES